MNEKFTKGRWDIEIGCTQAFVIGDNKFLHEGNIDFNDEERDERVANAYLIAAAPDMYEMLQGLYENACSVGDDSEWVDEIKEVLAKARGEL